MRLPKRARTFRRSAATPPQSPHAAAQTVTKPPSTPPQGSTTTESPMQGGAVDPETEALPMESSPPATQKVRGRPAHLIERRLDELDACVAKALTSRPRLSDSLFKDIHARTKFLRTLIATERDCHGGAQPEHLVEIEWRFGVLERTIEEWAQSVVAAPAEEEEEEPAREAAGSVSGSESGSRSGGCSCTGSCSGFEVTGQEAALDAKCNLDQDDAEAHKDKEAAVEAAATIEVPPATRPAARRRWWKRRAALCGAAGVVAMLALGAGLALEFAAVAQQSAYVVPT